MKMKERTPVVYLRESKEEKRHDDVEKVEDGEEDHQVVERLLSALPGEDEDVERVERTLGQLWDNWDYLETTSRQ